MSYKALFFNLPADGHINPSLPLVTELTQRGHEITYFTTNGYRAKVEAAGAKVQLYTDLKDDFFDPLTANGLHPQIVANALIDATETLLPDLLETAHAAEPDYILFDCMCMWGYYVGQILPVPSVASYSLMPPIIRAFLNKSTLPFMLPMVFRDFRKGVEAERRSKTLGKKYHVKPLDRVTMLSSEGDLSISYSSRAYVPYSQDASPSFRFVGRTPKEEPDVDPALLAQIGERPLVYVSMGTAFNQDRTVIKTLIAAFGGRDEFFMITTGRRFDLASFGPLPENIRLHHWLPQIALLKHASLFVSHGGLNSVHDGLYFGVPLLLCPQQEEQTMNSSRVVELGAGLILRKKHFSVEALRQSAGQLLTNPRFRENAQKIGETFRAAGGMSRAVDEIEALLKKKTQLK